MRRRFMSENEFGGTHSDQRECRKGACKGNFRIVAPGAVTACRHLFPRSLSVLQFAKQGHTFTG